MMEEFNSHKESDSKEFLEYLSNLDLSNLAADEKNRLQEMIEEKVTKVIRAVFEVLNGVGSLLQLILHAAWQNHQAFY